VAALKALETETLTKLLMTEPKPLGPGPDDETKDRDTSRNKGRDRRIVSWLLHLHLRRPPIRELPLVFPIAVIESDLRFIW
jgi:hypothetical protein